MSAFQELSLLSSFVTTLLLVGGLRKFPELIVKPSFLVIVFLNLTNQWSSAIHANQISSVLSHPFDYFMVVQLFPPLALIATGLFFNRDARKVFELAKEGPIVSRRFNRTLVVLMMLTVVIMLAYFRQVPFESTGLYVLFANPAEANVARESSLKTLDSSLIRYSYVIMSTAIIPMAAVMLGDRILFFLRGKKFTRLLPDLVAVGFLLFCVSVYGARAPAAMLLLTIGFAIFLRTDAFFNPVKVGAAVLVILTIPAIFSLLRDGTGWNTQSLVSNYLNVFDRTFGRGIDDGIWHMQYVQRHGFFGMAGAGNLAGIFGLEDINVFNTVGREFGPGRLASISANTTYVIAYYACFGLSAIVPCVVLLSLLDGILRIVPHLETSMILPCLVACDIAAINLSSTFYTTIFVTYGFLIIPVLGSLLGNIPRLELRVPSDGLKKDLNAR